MKKENKEIEEFREKITKELGYVSSLFMSQECKGTEIVMPTEELIEVANKIELYGYCLAEKAKEEERERTKKAFFTYLFNNSIEEELKGKFANEQYEKIWARIIKNLKINI